MTGPNGERNRRTDRSLSERAAEFSPIKLVSRWLIPVLTVLLLLVGYLGDRALGQLDKITGLLAQIQADISVMAERVSQNGRAIADHEGRLRWVERGTYPRPNPGGEPRP